MARVGELDSLRGFAAIAVMIFHAREAWLPFGWAAVDLFFVLSGYLITSIILRQGGRPGFLSSFYVRRGLRTWPIYYLLIAFLIVLSPVLPRAFEWPQLPFARNLHPGPESAVGWLAKPTRPVSRPHVVARHRRTVLPDLAGPGADRGSSAAWRSWRSSVRGA